MREVEVALHLVQCDTSPSKTNKRDRGREGGRDGTKSGIGIGSVSGSGSGIGNNVVRESRSAIGSRVTSGVSTFFSPSMFH